MSSDLTYNIQIRVGFYQYGSIWIKIDLSLDIICFTDIILRFFTGVQIKGEFVYNKKSIAKIYLRYSTFSCNNAIFLKETIFYRLDLRPPLILHQGLSGGN